MRSLLKLMVMATRVTTTTSRPVEGFGPVLLTRRASPGGRASASRQFKTLWFDDDLDGDLKVKITDKNPLPYRFKGANDLYGPDRGRAEQHSFREDGGVRDTDNVNQIWQMVIDEDNDPTSDFGKIDHGRAPRTTRRPPTTRRRSRS